MTQIPNPQAELHFRADPCVSNEMSTEGAFLFAFRGTDLLVRKPESAGPQTYNIPRVDAVVGITEHIVRRQPLGWLGDRPCTSAELAPATPEPEGYTFISIRRLHGHVDQSIFDAAGTAFQIQYWDRTNQFCSECGKPLALAEGQRSKHCPHCDHHYFPKVTPAIIVLVEDGPKILMTRQPRFPPGMYGLVAGFVEPGESFETTVKRETLEETGIEVSNIEYFGSQPWPFPHQIMVGFFARRTGGSLVVDQKELEEAQWFDRDTLPKLPPPISIARKLIDAWLTRAI